MEIVRLSNMNMNSGYRESHSQTLCISALASEFS